MSFLSSLFGKSKPSPEDDRELEEHLPYLNSLKEPAIALAPSDGKLNSRIGGMPTLPVEFEWPKWNDVPLAFLCQLDLTEIPEECVRNGLPSSGMLYFFYNQELETWGFDPKDKGSWAVLYTAKPDDERLQRSAPEGLNENCVYTEKTVTFTPIETYPDHQDARINALNLTDKQLDRYFDTCSPGSWDQTSHQLFGHPSPVQGNDMDLESQLVSHGLFCGDESGFNDPKAKELESGRSDWILLLQLLSDEQTDMMWGDLGTLYFWIKKKDLEEARFEDCWMILQCH